MTYTVSSGTLNSTIPYHTLQNYVLHVMFVNLWKWRLN